MKSFFIKHYSVFILLSYILYNHLLYNVKIGGLLYQITMIGVIIINTYELIKNKKELKDNSICILIFFVTLSLSKNVFQHLFNISNIITLIIIECKKRNIFVIIISIIIILLHIFCPLIFLLFIFDGDINEEREISDICEEMHYYCDNNYEAYAYSEGAMDRFHYSVGKHYEILNIKGLIYIRYSERNEVTFDEFQEIIKNHNGKLVGEIK